MIIAIRWQCDLFDSRLFVGSQPFGEVRLVPGKTTYEASVLLSSGLQKQKFVDRGEAMAHVERVVDEDVRRRLSAGARAALAAAAL